MLKPSDKWNWYFCENEGHLMLDLGEEMVFRTNLSRNLLVECALASTAFTVDDASDYQAFKDTIDLLKLSEPRKAELILNCVAAKRFHIPVQPKSWFFDTQNNTLSPEEGDLVTLSNTLNQGIFVVIESGEHASLCTCVELDGFDLNGRKALNFGQTIKVMHDRMESTDIKFSASQFAMVG